MRRPTKYLVVFRQNDRVGSEEYDAGTTIAAARKKAAFFIQHIPAHVSVRICRVTPAGGLHTVEVVR